MMHLFWILKGTQCFPICLVVAAYSKLENPNEWNPEKLDSLIRYGTNVASHLSHRNFVGKIEPNLNETYTYTFEEHLEVKCLILGIQKCLPVMDVLSFQIRYSLALTNIIMLRSDSNKEMILLFKESNKYYLFDSHGRSSTLERMDSPHSRAHFYRFSGEMLLKQLLR